MIVTNPFTDLKSWSRAQVEAISRGWWVLLLNGVVSTVAGGIIVFTDWTVSDLIVFIGTLLVVRGVFTMFSIPVDGSLRAWSILFGLGEVGVGVAVWVWPDPTLLVVAAFIGWLLLFRGLMAITGSLAGRRIIPYWGFLLAVGILEVAASFYLLSRPGLTLVATVLAIGLTAMFYGVAEIILAFEVKHFPEHFDELERELSRSPMKRPVETAA